MAEPHARDADKVIMGLHTVYRPTGLDEGLTGHGWVTITEHGKTTTYGAWPDTNDWVAKNHQEKGWNGSGTNVRLNLEQKLAAPAGWREAHRYYELTPAEVKKFQDRLAEPCHWTYVDNCSKWAVDTTEKVTGEKVASRDPRVGFLTQTPASLGDRIDELERRNPTNHDAPLEPAARELPKGSLQSSLHSAPPPSSSSPPSSSGRSLSDFVRPSSRGASATSEHAASSEPAAGQAPLRGGDHQR